MNVTATIIGQMVTFAILVLFIKAVLWEPMIKMLEERKVRIADGLAAAERGKRDRELAEKRATEVLRDAKKRASEVLSQAHRRATDIVEEAKAQARDEGRRLVHAARAEIDQEVNQAREALRAQLASLAVVGAERILEREVDANAHVRLLDELAEQL